MRCRGCCGYCYARAAVACECSARVWCLALVTFVVTCDVSSGGAVVLCLHRSRGVGQVLPLPMPPSPCVLLPETLTDSSLQCLAPEGTVSDVVVYVAAGGSQASASGLLAYDAPVLSAWHTPPCDTTGGCVAAFSGRSFGPQGHLEVGRAQSCALPQNIRDPSQPGRYSDDNSWCVDHPLDVYVLVPCVCFVPCAGAVCSSSGRWVSPCAFLLLQCDDDCTPARDVRDPTRRW